MKLRRLTSQVRAFFMMALLVGVTVLWSRILSDAARAEVLSSFCRDMNGGDSAWLDSWLPRGFAKDVDTIRALVRKLRKEFDIPLSFIEDRPNEPISLPEAELSLEELLRTVANQHEHYRCETFAGRLVLRSSDPIFDLMISGVDMVEQPRLWAVKTYIKHIRDFDQRVEDWGTPLTARGGSPSNIYSDPVTLSPRAPMIQHLFQLLGQDDDLYFDVPAPGPSAVPWRTIDLGAVRRPWQRRPVKVRHPADKTGEIQ